MATPALSARKLNPLALFDHWFWLPSAALIIIALTAFPVFASDQWICMGPPGGGGCGYAILPQRTLWQIISEGHVAIIPLTFLAATALAECAIIMRRRWVSALALLGAVCWAALLTVFLWTELPAPWLRGATVYSAVSLTALGALLLLVGNARLLSVKARPHP